ncbi:hypothetical protein AB0G02_24270 [Actinosynnema sp. NPDC023658]|uniref:hypothetical protein n=1 Tax=Actinosynnema sp. NPDC023658 TaxID=3155465 RepID=UPI0033CE694C
MPGFAFPKDGRAAPVTSQPAGFHPPTPSDLRYDRIGCALTEVDEDEPTELVVEAWRMRVPERVAAAHPGL